MANIDFGALSLDELRKLRKDVEKAIETFQERKKAEAREKVQEIAREFGFSLAELAEQSAVKSRKSAAPKYANPSDPAQTWTGRGRKPLWVVAALAAGKTLDDLKINR